MAGERDVGGGGDVKEPVYERGARVLGPRTECHERRAAQGHWGRAVPPATQRPLAESHLATGTQYDAAVGPHQPGTSPDGRHRTER